MKYEALAVKHLPSHSQTLMVPFLRLILETIATPVGLLRRHGYVSNLLFKSACARPRTLNIKWKDLIINQ